MLAIENFNKLSEQEAMQFAIDLINKVNSEKIFISNSYFKLSGLEVDEMTGNLNVLVENEDPIYVAREATWQCDTLEDINDDPGNNAEYSNLLFDEVKKAFKSDSTSIGSYMVTLDLIDVDDMDTTEVEVSNYSEEDAGIGSYEYCGHVGYDSQPYVEVEGIITRACWCTISLTVEPNINN